MKIHCPILKLNKKKGFTLVELLVVLAIMIFLTAIIGGGIVSLQNASRLDNSLRTLKVDIQSTQNLARNSFVSYSTSSVREENVNLFRQRKINIGWLIEISGSDKNIQWNKRAIYLDTAAVDIDPTLIDLDFLRQRVKDMINSQSGFYCTSDNKFSNNTGLVTLPLGQNLKALCSTESVGEFETNEGSPLQGIRLEEASNPNLCTQVNGKYTLFFSVGFGEVGLADACQIRVKNTGSFGLNTRALKIDDATSNIVTCGKDCFAK